MEYLAKAIKNLKPESEFSYQGEDYSTINWIVLNGNAPTQKAINDEIKRIKENEIFEAQARAEQKTALLAQLGITEEQAKLLLS